MPPLDAGQLEACLEDFPTHARTLPAAAYTHPGVLEWELTNFYEGSWFCAGRAGRLKEPGDRTAIVAGTESVLLVKGEDSSIRAFSNVCRHRGHELIGCGEWGGGKVVRCPYHRWTYALNGDFMGGPGLASQEGFDKRDPANSLVRLRAVEWGGFVFVNVSGEAPEFDDHIGTLEDLTAGYRLDRLFEGAGHSYEIAANWKIVVENYHECYHCSEIHPELCTVSSPGSGYDYEPSGLVIGGTMELLEHADTMSLDGKSKGTPFPGLSEQQLREVHYLQVFPNLLLSIHPDYVMTHTLQPVAANRTRIECTWLFAPEAKERPDFTPSYAAEFWDVVNRQDWAACEAVQRGASGRGYRQSPFSDQELVVHQSMSLVARGYLAGRAPSPTTERKDDLAVG
jgi:Rieske 2Fe-2S family protein